MQVARVIAIVVMPGVQLLDVSGPLDVFAEAKGNGFDVKALRTIVRLRKQDAGERAEQETILETYMQALGML